MNNYLKQFSIGIAPDPMLTLSEWAEAERVLPSGPWDNTRNPQQVEIMDCLSFNSPYKFVVFKAARQLGKSEVGLNSIGQSIDKRPTNIMVVQSTVETAETFSDMRIARMIAETPALTEKCNHTKSRDSSSTKRKKTFPGGTLLINGANSAAGLRALPIEYLWLDEVSSYPYDVDNEGDPVKIVIETTNTFPYAKILMTSTPKNLGSCRITEWYENSDKRVLKVPCPHCYEYQELKFENFKFKYSGAFGIEDTPYFLCTECDRNIEETTKQYLLDNHKWVKTGVERKKERIAGFAENAFYAPVGFLSWYSIALDWLETRKNKDVALLKSFINNKLAEAWDPLREADTVEGEDLYQHREDYDYVPNNCGFLVCAVDVQKDRLEYEVKAFAEGDESYGIEYGTFDGSPSQQHVWQDLSDFIQKKFLHASGSSVPIMATCIDSGGHHTQEVYNFVALHRDKRVFAFKGSSTYDSPIAPNKPTHIKSKNVLLYNIGVSLAKEQIFYRLKLNEPGPGAFHWNKTYSRDYFEQLTAEILEEKYTRGKLIKRWRKRNEKARNEALDLTVYCYALIHIIKPNLTLYAARAQKGEFFLNASVQRKRKKRTTGSAIH